MLLHMLELIYSRKSNIIHSCIVGSIWIIFAFIFYTSIILFYFIEKSFPFSSKQVATNQKCDIDS